MLVELEAPAAVAGAALWEEEGRVLRFIRRMIGLKTGVFVIRTGIGDGAGVPRSKRAVARARTQNKRVDDQDDGSRHGKRVLLSRGVLGPRPCFDSLCGHGGG